MARCPLLLLVAVLAGCAASTTAVPPPGEIAPRPRAVAALADSLRAAPSAADRRAVAVRWLAATGATPLAGGTFEAGVGVPFVGGFVPGHQPLVRDQLVVVGVSLERPLAAAATLEAVRVLVAHSRWGTVPERTVQVVFWSGGTTDRAGAEGALRLPLWPRDLVAAVVVISDDDGALVVSDLPVTVVPADGTPALAARVVQTAVRLAAAPLPPDTDPR